MDANVLFLKYEDMHRVSAGDAVPWGPLPAGAVGCAELARATCGTGVCTGPPSRSVSLRLFLSDCCPHAAGSPAPATASVMSLGSLPLGGRQATACMSNYTDSLLFFQPVPPAAILRSLCGSSPSRTFFRYPRATRSPLTGAALLPFPPRPSLVPCSFPSVCYSWGLGGGEGFCGSARHLTWQLSKVSVEPARGPHRWMALILSPWAPGARGYVRVGCAAAA